MAQGDRPATHRVNLRFNRERIADACFLVVGLLALATLFTFLAEAWWAFDLFSHFRVQYAVTAVVLAGILWALRRRWIALLALAIAATNAWFVVPLYARAAEARETPAREMLRVLSLNVFGFNDDYDRVFDYVRRERPDVLVLIEITPHWAEASGDLAREFAYHWVHPGSMRSGIAVYSRRKPIRAQELDLADTGAPSMLLTLQTAAGPLSILGTHLYWPMGESVSQVRNRQLDLLGELARKHPVPLIIAGDLNVSPFSPHFSRLLRDGALRNCAQGLGVKPTWPARVPFLFIQIDHCLATAGAHVRDFRVGSYVGSDHYPIVMDVAIP